MSSKCSGWERGRLARRIYYEIVSRCNLRCMHCSDLFHAPNRELVASDVLRFHSVVEKLGVVDSVLTGGEPTLHSELDVLVDGLCAYGAVSLTTNGLSLPARRAIDLLRRHPRLFMQVSMDGATKETFELIRGRETFGRVVKFIGALAACGLSRQLGLSMTVLAQNIDEVDGVIEFAAEHGVRAVHFPQLVPVGFARENWENIAPSARQQIEMERLLLERASSQREGPEVSINRLDRLAGWYLFGAEADCLQTFTLKVGPDGEILPCPTTANRECSLGSVREQWQPAQLLERLERQARALRAFSDRGPPCAASASESSPTKEAARVRSCESCWVLAPPREDIAEYGRVIREAHTCAAYATDASIKVTPACAKGARQSAAK